MIFKNSPETIADQWASLGHFWAFQTYPEFSSFELRKPLETLCFALFCHNLIFEFGVEKEVSAKTIGLLSFQND